MQYEWEYKIHESIEDISDLLPEGFELVGLAVESVDTGEAALIDANHRGYMESGDVVEADVRKDILGDAMEQYEKARKAAFGEIN